MSINKHRPHVIVIPEDDANRQLALGFILFLSSKSIAVHHPTRGWKKALDALLRDHIEPLRSIRSRHVILLIDFDGDFKRRKEHFERQLPDEIRERIYLIGCLNEPENLKKDCNMTFEKIGTALAQSCLNGEDGLWSHAALAHNQAELDRLKKTVRPILFN